MILMKKHKTQLEIAHELSDHFGMKVKGTKCTVKYWADCLSEMETTSEECAGCDHLKPDYPDFTALVEVDCDACGGEGDKYVTYEEMPGRPYDAKPIRKSCPTCHGDGVRLFSLLQKMAEEKESTYPQYKTMWEGFLNWPELTPEHITNHYALTRKYHEWIQEG